MVDVVPARDNRLHGVPTRCKPHVLNVSFPGIDSEALMMALRDKIAISNGSACTSSSYQPSHVLVVMGPEPGPIRNAVRVSYGHTNVLDFVQRCIGAIAQFMFTAEFPAESE